MGLQHSLFGIILTLSFGVVIGLLLAWFVLPSRQNKKIREQLKATEEKLQRYQEDVRDHFVKTSDLVNNLTSTYHQLHEHLSVGAYMLGSQSLSNESSRLRDLQFNQFGSHEKEEPQRLHYSSISPSISPSITLDKKDALIEESYA